MTPEQVVRAHLSAFGAGDLEGTLAPLTDSTRFVTAGTAVAPMDFPEFFGWAIRELSPQIRITNLVADSGHVACEFVETVTEGGQQRSLERAAFYRVDDHKITTATVYD